MGFRFQRRVSLFPGVRLNFSARGISTTIGVRGASINIGSRGTYVNAGLPGTGLSYRARVSPTHVRQPSSPVFPSAVAYQGPETQITSADTGSLTSPGLESLRTLIREAIERRRVLNKALKHAARREALATFMVRVASFYIVRLLTQRFVPRLALRVFNRTQQRLEIEEQLGACAVDVDFGLCEESLTRFDNLMKAFDALSQCDRIWDVTSSSSIDRLRARSWATTAVRRKLVRFGLTNLDAIQSEKLALNLENANGLDLVIYPAFAIAWSSRDEFALIDIRDVRIRGSVTSFVEEDTVSSDSTLIGHTWRKANKDGSRDRRFNSNYQIPIVQYGELHFFSGTGLNEAYMFSSYSKSAAFESAWGSHIQGLKEAPANAVANVSEQFLDSATDGGEWHEARFVAPSPPKTLVYDWVALPFVVGAIVVGSWGLAYEVPKIFDQLSTIRIRTVEAPKLPKSEPLSAAAVPELEYFVVVPRSVNIRSSPSRSSSIVGHAKRGDAFAAFSKRDGWYQVGIDHAVGWIREDLLATQEGR